VLPQPDRGPDDPPSFSLAVLVERTGVPASTIHHYRRTGLLPAPRRAAANRFVYDESHVSAVRAIRLLRERRGVSLGRIGELLPGLLAEHGDAFGAGLWAEAAGGDELAGTVTANRRVVDAAIELFGIHGYAEVAVRHIAELAGVAKGSVYQHFPSKDALFTAAVETVVADVATNFAMAVAEVGGRASVRDDEEKAAAIFAELISPAMPILLELGARAAQGHPGSEELALRVLYTLAEATGKSLADDPVSAGLALIQAAIAATLRSVVQPGQIEAADDGP
jgi:AcrR family transcriptional regulator